MQRNLRIIASLTVATSLIVVFYSLFSLNAYLVKEIPIKFEVGEIIGIDVNSTALSFGRIPQGSTSTRTITVSNIRPQEVKVVLKAEGETRDFISFEQNSIILKPFETKEIKIFATPSLDSKNKEYAGNLKIFSIKT